MNVGKQQELLSLFQAKQYYCLEDGFVASLKDGYPRVLQPSRNNQGYYLVTLMGGRRITVSVHQVVYLFFKGSFDPALQINHLDGKKLNNSIANLELVTASDNQLHASRLGLFRDQRGRRNNMAKVTAKEVLEIRAKLQAGATQVEVAEYYGVTSGNIHCIATRKTWRHI